MTKLAQAIGKEEGFGIPGALPTRNHNPGDLRHSPHSTHTAAAPEAIGNIDTDENGWADLERQLRIYAQRGMTLQECVAVYAPPNENNSARYLADVCKFMGLPPSTLVSEALKF